MENGFYESRQPEADLVRALRASGLNFVASPFGRWVRFERDGNPMYLVADPWGAGCCLLSLNASGGRETQHFLSPEAALAELVWTTNPSLDQGGDPGATGNRLSELIDRGVPAA